MDCPSCGEPRSAETQRCPHCGAEPEGEGPSRPDPRRELVTVHRTSRPDLLPLIESILRDAGIPYSVKGEELVGLFPGSFSGLLIDPRRSAEIQVAADREEEARALLEELEIEEGPSDEEAD